MKDQDQILLENLYQENVMFDWDSLKYKHKEDENYNRLDFFNRNGAVGYIEWSKDDGEIDKIFVGDPYRRLGVGTYIWETATDWAKENNQPEPEHSSRRSYEGEQFAQHVGGYIPRLTDDIDGWSSSR
jgi:GNAT superfamily N-acetyltransferase